MKSMIVKTSSRIFRTFNSVTVTNKSVYSIYCEFYPETIPLKYCD